MTDADLIARLARLLDLYRNSPIDRVVLEANSGDEADDLTLADLADIARLIGA